MIMKYLVNRETKEHKVYYGMELYDDEAWRVVDADDEGWIKWGGKSNKCPLPDDAKVSVRWNYSDKISSDLLAGDWSWNDSQLAFYRPILTDESKVDPENAWPDDGMPASVYIDVFRRFNAAVAASDSIPGLIAEINAMLPEGYEVREKAKPQAAGISIASQMAWNGNQYPNYMNCANPVRI
jgi:hypothetical protein